MGDVVFLVCVIKILYFFDFKFWRRFESFVFCEMVLEIIIKFDGVGWFNVYERMFINMLLSVIDGFLFFDIIIVKKKK